MRGERLLRPLRARDAQMTVELAVMTPVANRTAGTPMKIAMRTTAMTATVGALEARWGAGVCCWDVG